MDASTQLSAALDKLWAQFLPQMLERIAVMEAANEAFAAGRLTVDQRAEANAAAHKLAGVLGTFGLTRGTVLAREAEVLYSAPLEDEAGSLPRLQEIAIQLRALVNSRK